MTMHLRKPKALIAARADGSNVAALIASLNATFEEFKQKNDDRIKGVEDRFDDVVAREQVDRINADITALQGAVDEAVRSVAALNLGGNPAEPLAAERAEHAEAFETWFRRGVDNGIGELEVRANLSTGSDPDGGFVVPVEMETSIDRVLANESAVRSLATVRSISAATFKKLINMGGASSGWVGEEDARPDTGTPKLRGLEFPVHELYANPASTQTALDDASMDLAAWLADEVSVEFGEQEGDAFINGGGVAKPKGILGYQTVVNSNYAWGKVGFIKTGAAADFPALDAASEVSPADPLVSLVHSLRRQYRRNGTFLMNDLTIERVRKFKDADANYIWRPSIEAGASSTLLGYSVVTDDFMPDIAANAFPIAFADFRRAYLVLDRQGVRVLRDPFTNKPNVHFYTTKRVGGGIQNFEAIKLLRVQS
ncbi:MAG: phage major capsid protein [Pseudomonadota bacterium]